MRFTSSFTAILLMFVFISARQGFAQSEIQAKQGPQGIYLFLGKNIPSGKITLSYKIERQQEDGPWKVIANVQSPLAFQSFISEIDKAKALLPSQPLPASARLQQIYNRAIETGTSDSLRGTILHYPVKVALGLIYHDPAAKSGKAFRYRVTEIMAGGSAMEPVLTDTLSMPYKATFDEVQLVETSRSDKAIRIKWKSWGSNPAPLFMIHRVENNKPVNAGGLTGRFSINDTTFFTFTDSLKPGQEQKELRYFFSPYDLLGNAGTPSRTVVLTDDPFNRSGFSSVLATRLPDRYGYRVSWRFTNPGTARAMEVYRGEWSDKGFVQLASLTGKDTVYTDDRVKPEKDYYYYIQAVSASGNRLKPSQKVLAPAFNQRKLLAPLLAEARGFPGGVSLLLKDLDPQATGIRVFRRLAGQQNLVAITELLPFKNDSLWFADSSASLSGRYLYEYAVRVEKPGYGISDLSQIASAMPGLSPVPPVPAFVRAQPAEKIVKLYWDDLRSRDPEVAGYEITRLAIPADGIGMAAFAPLGQASLLYPGNELTDSTVSEGMVYTYAIRAVDSIRKLKSQPVHISVSFNGLQPPVEAIQKQNRESLRLEWVPMVFEGMDSYVVYRQLPGSAPGQVASLPPHVSELEIALTSADSQAEYSITCRNKAGQESKPVVASRK